MYPLAVGWFALSCRMESKESLDPEGVPFWRIQEARSGRAQRVARTEATMILAGIDPTTQESLNALGLV